MLSIPIPFVVSLLLGILAVTLYVRLGAQAKTTCWFLALCATTTLLVGLRWTYDVALFAVAQPIFASLIPVVAWHIFTRTKNTSGKLACLHGLGPLLIAVSIVTHPFLALPLDEILTAMYLCYGMALVRYCAKEPLLIHVSLSHWEGVKKAENIAGWMLLFSAAIDAAITLDFAVNQGRYAPYIVTFGHVVLLPALAVAVVIVGINTPDDITTPEIPDLSTSDPEPLMSAARAHEIASRLDTLMQEKTSYLDPDLTLAALSRKLCIPAKQISTAVNQVHRQSISRVINQYRIEHAKQALLTSDDTITRILLSAGFQTKSNFNREFSRITGQTPSEFRQQRDISPP